MTAIAKRVVRAVTRKAGGSRVEFIALYHTVREGYKALRDTQGNLMETLRKTRKPNFGDVQR